MLYNKQIGTIRDKTGTMKDGYGFMSLLVTNNLLFRVSVGLSNACLKCI